MSLETRKAIEPGWIPRTGILAACVSGLQWRLRDGFLAAPIKMPPALPRKGEFKERDESWGFDHSEFVPAYLFANDGPRGSPSQGQTMLKEGLARLGTAFQGGILRISDLVYLRQDEEKAAKCCQGMKRKMLMKTEGSQASTSSVSIMNP